jgi:hypothetical protein
LPLTAFYGHKPSKRRKRHSDNARTFIEFKAVPGELSDKGS